MILNPFHVLTHLLGSQTSPLPLRADCCLILCLQTFYQLVRGTIVYTKQCPEILGPYLCSKRIPHTRHVMFTLAHQKKGIQNCLRVLVCMNNDLNRYFTSYKH